MVRVQISYRAVLISGCVQKIYTGLINVRTVPVPSGVSDSVSDCCKMIGMYKADV